MNPGSAAMAADGVVAAGDGRLRGGRDLTRQRIGHRDRVHGRPRCLDYLDVLARGQIFQEQAGFQTSAAHSELAVAHAVGAGQHRQAAFGGDAGGGLRPGSGAAAQGM